MISELQSCLNRRSLINPNPSGQRAKFAKICRIEGEFWPKNCTTNWSILHDKGREFDPIDVVLETRVCRESMTQRALRKRAMRLELTTFSLEG